jgi:hypothetical protein
VDCGGKELHGGREADGIEEVSNCLFYRTMTFLLRRRVLTAYFIGSERPATLHTLGDLANIRFKSIAQLLRLFSLLHPSSHARSP